MKVSEIMAAVMTAAAILVVPGMMLTSAVRNWRKGNKEEAKYDMTFFGVVMFVVVLYGLAVSGF
jgi:uncharacterized membrane protein